MPARKPDLLLLIAAWEFVTIALAAIFIAALLIYAWPEIDTGLAGAPRIFGLFGITLGIAVMLGYISIAVVGGIGLLRSKNWGRILTIAHSGASLLWLPIGTIIGVLVIIYLVKSEVVDYFNGAGTTS